MKRKTEDLIQFSEEENLFKAIEIISND